MRYKAAVIAAFALLCIGDAAHALQFALTPAPKRASNPGHEKSPTLARAIGILPGAGHVYAGEPERGLIYFGATVGATILAANVGDECSKDPWTLEEYCSPTTLGTLTMLTMLGVWGWSIVDAGRAARRTNARRVRVTGMLIERTSLGHSPPVTRVGLSLQWARVSR